MSEIIESRREARERQKRERKKEKLEKQLHRIEIQQVVDQKSEDDGRQKTKMAALQDIMGTKRIRSKMKKKKHQKLLHKLLAIEDDRTPEDLQEVENFREILRAENLLPQKYDDYHTLLRFLNARKFDMEKAKVMWENWMKWRAEVGADTIRETFSFPEAAEVKVQYPQGHHGVDREGRPVYIELVGKADATKVFGITTIERYVDYHISEFEKTLDEKFPACSVAKGKLINKTTTIMDVSGFGWKNFTKDARDLFGRIQNIDSNYYPETLHRLYVINAGATFRAIWATVKPLLDPVTAAKIVVLGAGREKLFEAVDPNELPAVIGGNCSCADVPGGCFNSDRGPWNNPEIMKMVTIRQTRKLPENGVEDLVGYARKLEWISPSFRSDAESETETGSDTDHHSGALPPLSQADLDKLAPVFEENNSFLAGHGPPSTRRFTAAQQQQQAGNPGPSNAASYSHSVSGSTDVSSDDDIYRPRKMAPIRARLPSEGAASNVPLSSTKLPETPISVAKPQASAAASDRQLAASVKLAQKVTLFAFVVSVFAKLYGVLQSIVAGPSRAAPALAPATVQIMQRVQSLEVKVGRLESGPSTPALDRDGSEWPEKAASRVKGLEDELAETKKTLAELRERQLAMRALLTDLQDAKFSKRRFLCCG